MLKKNYIVKNYEISLNEQCLIYIISSILVINTKKLIPWKQMKIVIKQTARCLSFRMSFLYNNTL